MDSTQPRPELPRPLRAPNVVSNQAMGRLCGLLTSDLEEPASASIPALLGRYRIIRPLAEGASGRVYEAEDLQLGRRVAMKVLGADADSMVKRFFREASVAAKLRHPNLITIHEVSMARRGDGSPVHFIVMDLHPRTLEAVLEKNELARDERLRLLEQVARAVHHAHDNGVVHRDLKPANILIDERGHPVVSDFGLAREESQTTLTRSGVPVGTPSYMSPEQVAGRAAVIGPRSDVYALGVILYRMLTNRLPFDGASVAEVYSSILAEDPTPPDADRDLQTICLKAMDRERDRRYATALDFAEDVRRFLAGEPILARPDRTIRRLRRLARAPAVWVAAAGTVLVGAVGFWAWKVGHREQAVIDRESAGDRVQQIDGAYTALHQGRAEALRYLEDAFHGGNDGRQSAAMVERIESLVREMSASRPLTGLPAAWLGLARVFAGDAGGWRDLDAAVDRAGDDPFPLLLRARAHLAVYSREIQLAATIRRDGERRVLELGTLVETADMRDRLARAAGDIARASASPLWPALPAATDYHVYAEGASLLGRGDHQKAAMRLEAIRDHAVLGSEAECLRGICFALVRDSAAAAECWERLTPRGWPMVLLAAARARLDAGRAGDDLRHYEHAARNAGNVRADGDLAKFALLAAGHSWQLIGRRRKQAGEDPSQAFGRAGDAFAKAVALDETFGPAWCELAEVCDSLGDEKGALHNARTAVRVEPRHGRAWQVLAAVAQAAAKRRGYGTPDGGELLGEAVAAGARAADAEPDNADFRFTAGHVCWQAARASDKPEAHLRQAIAHFDAAVRIRKGFGNAVGERGHAWLELAEHQLRSHADPRAAYENAIADYAEAMALGTEPDLCRRYRGVAHRCLAEYLYEAGQDGGPHLDQAERDHTEGIRANPRDAESYRLRAFVHRGRAYAPGASLAAHVRKGLADLAEAIRIDPDLIQAYADQAEAHAAIDEFDEALACVDAGLKRAPRHGGLLDLRKRLREFIRKRGEDE